MNISTNNGISEAKTPIQPVELNIGQDVLRGILREPRQNRYPNHCILFLAGPGTTRCGPHRLNWEIAERIAQLGLRSFRFDYRGRGESSGQEDNLDVESMYEDAVWCYNALTRSFPLLQQIIIIAVCMGAISGIKLMESNPHVCDGIFLGAPRYIPKVPMAEKFQYSKYMMNKYLAKVLHRETWKRIIENKVDYMAVVRTLFGQYQKYVPQYRDKDNLLNVIRSRMTLEDKSSNTEKQLLFVYGQYDPAKIGCMRFYRKFCKMKGWRYKALEINKSDRTFNNHKAVRKVAEIICNHILSICS